MAKPRGRTFKDCAGYSGLVNAAPASGVSGVYVAVGASDEFGGWHGVWLTPTKARDMADYIRKLADVIEVE
jgi:hypothetical protein